MRITIPKINPDAEVCQQCHKETVDWLETKFFGEWLLLCSKCKQELEGDE